MRWGILGARVAIISVNLLIAAIIILSVLPLANGGLRIDIPQGDVGAPTFDGNVARFSVPVEIYNGGYFDITGLMLRFVILSDDVQVVNYATVPVDVVTGKTTTLNIDLALDLRAIPPAALQKLVFEQSQLDLSVGMEAAYTLGMVKASVHANQTMNWDPLISNLVVDTSAAQAQQNGTNVDVTIPYSFNANSIITGNVVSIDTTVRNATAQLGSSSHELTVQSYNSGMFKFTIDQAALMSNQDLTIEAELGFGGASVLREYTYHWNGVMT